VFANNRLSSVIDTGESTKMIKAEYVFPICFAKLWLIFTISRPSKKYEKAGGVAALVEHWYVRSPAYLYYNSSHSCTTSADECFKAAAFMPNFFADSQMMLSDEPNATPFNMAFKTPAHLFDFYAQPENEFRHLRFGAAMAGTVKLFPPDHILRGEIRVLWDRSSC
jgi:hypothetical protein